MKVVYRAKPRRFHVQFLANGWEFWRAFHTEEEAAEEADKLTETKELVRVIDTGEQP